MFYRANSLVEFIADRSKYYEFRGESVSKPDENCREEMAAYHFAKIKSEPQRVRGYVDLSDVFLSMGYVTDAQMILDKCLIILPGHPLALYRRIRIAENYQFDLLFLSQTVGKFHSVGDERLRNYIEVLSNKYKISPGKNLVHGASNFFNALSKGDYSALHKENLSSQDRDDVLSSGWAILSADSYPAGFFEEFSMPLFGESATSPRVMFFTRCAYIREKLNADLLKKICRKYLDLQNYDECCSLIESFLGDFDFELAHLYAMSSFLCGRYSSGFLRSRIDFNAKNNYYFKIIEFNRDRRSEDRLGCKGSSFTSPLLKSLVSDKEYSPAVDRYISSDKFSLPVAAKKSNKIAVCISGQLRGFSENAENIKKNIVDKFDCDVFFHVWDQEACYPPRFRFLDRIFGRRIAEEIPLDFKDYVVFAHKLPETVAKIKRGSVSLIDENRIISYFPGASIFVESEKNFLSKYDISRDLYHARTINQLKMFYKIYACDAVRRQREIVEGFEYDAVIRIRPDLNLRVENFQFYKNDCSLDKNKIYVSYVNADGVGDQFAIGSSESMAAYSSVFCNLIDFGKYNYMSGFNGEPAEPLVARHLMSMGLDVGVIRQENGFGELLAGLAVDHLDLSFEIERDLRNSPDLELFSNFLKEYKKHTVSRIPEAFLEKFWSNY